MPSPSFAATSERYAARPSPLRYSFPFVLTFGPYPRFLGLGHQPFAVMGASGGMSGTMRAQYHLRQIAVFLDMHALDKPEVFVRNASEAFDSNGMLKDETTRKLIAQQLTGLVAWTRQLARQ